jgi:hypothetical protein
MYLPWCLCCCLVMHALMYCLLTCKKTCESNKGNREKVQFQQKTRSRSYGAHIYAIVRTCLFFYLYLSWCMCWCLHIPSCKKTHCLICWITFQKEERKGEVLSAIDMFKVTHNSKKDGYSEPVKRAIVSLTLQSVCSSHMLLHLLAYMLSCHITFEF